jgi:hypothetical protein
MEYYEGEIGRLVVFGGTRGSGKTSFLQTPGEYFPLKDLPNDLSDAPSFAPLNKGLIPLHRLYRHCDYSTLWLHVDLFNPVGKSGVRKTEDDLVSALDEGLFEESRLLEFIHRANEIHFVTLYVSRDIAYERLRRRILKRGEEVTFPELVRLIYGIDEDLSFNSNKRAGMVHDALFRSWFRFTESVDARSRWTLRADKTPYDLFKGSIFPE